MAQEAFERTKKEMDLATEMRVARLIMNDAQQLGDRAAVEGVTAFLKRPVHRAPPNERFLQNTLRSVEFANQKSDVDEMWRMRQKQLEREKKRERGKRRSDDERNHSVEKKRDDRRLHHPRRKFPRIKKSENGAFQSEQAFVSDVDDEGERERRENSAAGSWREASEMLRSKEDCGADSKMKRNKRKRENECDRRSQSDSEKRVRDEMGHTSCSSGDEEDRLRKFLASKHVRGRGGVGSRGQDGENMDCFVEPVSKQMGGSSQQHEYPYVFSDDDCVEFPGVENGKKNRNDKKKKKKKGGKKSKRESRKEEEEQEMGGGKKKKKGGKKSKRESRKEEEEQEMGGGKEKKKKKKKMKKEKEKENEERERKRKRKKKKSGLTDTRLKD